MEGAVRVCLADTAGDLAVFRDGVLEQIAHHAVIVHLAILVGGKVIVHHFECLRAVVIVRIDDGKGAVDKRLCGQNRVAGAPGLDTALRDGEALRQLVQLLERVFHVHHLGDTVADGRLKGILDLVLDDKNDRLKACAAGIVERVIHNDLPIAAHRVDLLHAAVGCPCQPP